MFSGIAVQSKYTICSVMLVTQAYYSCVSWYISPSPLCQRLEYCCFPAIITQAKLYPRGLQLLGIYCVIGAYIMHVLYIGPSRISFLSTPIYLWF